MQHRLFPDNVREIRRSFTRGTRSLSLPAWVRIQGEADMIRQAKPAELVENDPQLPLRSSAPCSATFMRTATLGPAVHPAALTCQRPVARHLGSVFSDMTSN